MMDGEKRYALIGRNVSRSLSKKLHGFFADYEYDLISAADCGELAKVLADTEYGGFNITAPYKTDVVAMLDELSPEAELLGAVNTVVRLPDGRLRGCNTDLFGFMKMTGTAAAGRRVLVLGSGGAAAAAREGLRRLGAEEIITVSRHPELLTDMPEDAKCSYSTIIEHADADMIVNATPVGMYPGNGNSPFSVNGTGLSLFRGLELAVDMIYDPYRTRFLLDARNTGAEVISGHRMLVYQALLSNEIWTGNDRTESERDAAASDALRKLLADQLNIAVIGMPGSGKSSISRQLAIAMKRPFADIDRVIRGELGEDISDIIADPERGEAFFRKKETETVKRICRESGQVIATGGGSILRRVNRDRLCENSIVVYIKRPLEMLAVKGRPISAAKGVNDLYRRRGGIYSGLADITVMNSVEFGTTIGRDGRKNSYRYDMKRFVYKLLGKIEEYIDEIADN